MIATTAPRSVVHLLCPRTCGDEAILLCAALLARPDALVRQRTLIIGTIADARRAAGLGIPNVDIVLPIMGRVDACWRSVARFMSTLEHSGEPVGLMHAWCGETLRLARLVSPSGRRVCTPVRAPSPRRSFFGSPTSLARRLITPAGPLETWGVFDQAMCDQLGGFAPHGVPADTARSRVRLLHAPAISPLDPLARRGSSTTVTGPFGLTPMDRCVLFACLDPARADSLSFAFSLGLIYLLGVRVVGLMPRDASDVRRAARFVRLHGRRWGLVVSAATLPELVRAADVIAYDPCGTACGPGPALCQLARERNISVIVPTKDPGPSQLDEVCIGVAPKATAVASAIGALLTSGRAAPAPGFARNSGSLDRHAPADVVSLWHEVLNLPTARERPLERRDPEAVLAT